MPVYLGFNLYGHDLGAETRSTSGKAASPYGVLQSYISTPKCVLGLGYGLLAFQAWSLQITGSSLSTNMVSFQASMLGNIRICDLSARIS